MARIAFMGLGKMGLGMAGRLLAAGHELNVYNRTPAKAAPLVERGARLCASPAEACREAEAVVSMVADDAASREVWLGDDGVLAAVGRRDDAGQDGRAGGVSASCGESLAGGARARGVFAIECSTLSHDWVAELAAVARSRGLRYIDAPVTGLPDTAAAGVLTLLVGADTVDLDGARPILGAFSQRIIHFGAVGTGTAYKLIINMLGAVQIASAAESMALAERAGLDLEVVAEAIATGQAASPQVVRNTRRMVEGDRNRNITFTPRLRLKDVDYALRLARKLDLGAPFGGLAAQIFRQLCDGGHAEENESNVMRIAREQRGG
jgi:3-hydroxyisobutyrate dehydrogenase